MNYRTDKKVAPKTPASYSVSDIQVLLTTLMDCEDISEVQEEIKKFVPGVFE